MQTKNHKQPIFYKIVAARYNEDITWLHKEKDKGKQLNINNEILLKADMSDQFFYF